MQLRTRGEWAKSVEGRSIRAASTVESRTVQELLGQRHLKTTMIYPHVLAAGRGV